MCSKRLLLLSNYLNVEFTIDVPVLLNYITYVSNSISGYAY